MTMTMLMVVAYTGLSQVYVPCGSKSNPCYTVSKDALIVSKDGARIDFGTGATDYVVKQGEDLKEAPSNVCSQVDVAAELGFILIGCIYFILTIGSKLDKVVGAWRRAEVSVAADTGSVRTPHRLVNRVLDWLRQLVRGATQRGVESHCSVEEAAIQPDLHQRREHQPLPRHVWW